MRDNHSPWDLQTAHRLQQTKDFYMQFYGCKLTDEQANMIIAGERPK